MTQTWHDLLFAHWSLDPFTVRRLVPAPFELDLFAGLAWVGVVPFYMTNVAPRWTPSLPWLSRFPELNVRTYVRVDGKPGIYFFSLDAGRQLAVKAARTLFNLPYFAADMSVVKGKDGVHYTTTRRKGDAAFEGRYGPMGDPFTATPGSIEYFLTERYCLYNLTAGGRPYRLDIHHRPWRLQPAWLDSTCNSMLRANGLRVEGAPALLHYARRQDTVAWGPASLGAAVSGDPFPNYVRSDVRA